jgi:signal transduction histidine kinase
MIESGSPDGELARWTFLAEATQRLAAAVDYAETLQAVAALALPRPGEWSIVDLVEQDGSTHRLPVVHADPEKQRLVRALGSFWPPAGSNLLGIPAGLRSRGARVVDPITDEWLTDVARDEEQLVILRRLGITAMITVPLQAHDQVQGAIRFVGGSAGQGYTDDELALAQDLASRCALAIAHMRRVEELKKSVLLRDQVLGYVAHDLKNPLGAIVFGASHILDEARSPRQDLPAAHRIRVAESILGATEHMQRLIGDLLEVALIGAGGVTIHRQRVEPTGLVEGVRHTYEEGLLARSLRLETAVPEGLPVVWADPGRLRQVFENLLENAAKFTPSGGVVTLGASQLDGSVLFSVADTGGGIQSEEIPRLFDRFWQARQVGGGSAGLGLTICKGIVEAHGGAIWAESAVGQGSTFFFRIPAAPQPEWLEDVAAD